MNLKNAFFVIIVCTLTGCISSRSYIGLEATKPVPSNLFGAPFGEGLIPVVESTTPILEWKAIDVQGFTYDLIIWKRAESGRERIIASGNSEVVYLKEAISTNQHKVETPLEYDTVYLWSVRSRKGEEVGDWSNYKEQMVSAVLIEWSVKNYGFKTPKSNSENNAD